MRYNWHLKKRLELFLKTCVLKNSAIFTRKHLCWKLFSIKLQAWKHATLLKGDSNKGVFLWILRHFQEQLFCRTPLVAASTSTSMISCTLQRFCACAEAGVHSLHLLWFYIIHTAVCGSRDRRSGQEEFKKKGENTMVGKGVHTPLF